MHSVTATLQPDVIWGERENLLQNAVTELIWFLIHSRNDHMMNDVLGNTCYNIYRITINIDDHFSNLDINKPIVIVSLSL